MHACITWCCDWPVHGRGGTMTLNLKFLPHTNIRLYFGRVTAQKKIFLIKQKQLFTQTILNSVQYCKHSTKYSHMPYVSRDIRAGRCCFTVFSTSRCHCTSAGRGGRLVFYSYFTCYPYYKKARCCVTYVMFVGGCLLVLLFLTFNNVDFCLQFFLCAMSTGTES